MIEYQNRDPNLETSGEIIGFYEREFSCFSNFSSFSVDWQDQHWPTSEHAYQASRFFETSLLLANRIRLAPSAHAARVIAHENEMRTPESWKRHKITIMEDICRHKLKQHPYVRKKLFQTGNRLIVEDSPKDSFWGWGADRTGQNELGKIWMRLRDELYIRQSNAAA